jgi:hypothetical protein
MCKLDSGSYASCTSPVVYNNQSAGGHTVTVKDANGCEKTSNSVTITVPTPISASETTTPATCNGASDGQVTVTVSGGTAPYSVTVHGTTQSVLTSGGSTTFTAYQPELTQQLSRMDTIVRDRRQESKSANRPRWPIR